MLGMCTLCSIYVIRVTNATHSDILHDSKSYDVARPARLHPVRVAALAAGREEADVINVVRPADPRTKLARVLSRSGFQLQGRCSRSAVLPDGILCKKVRILRHNLASKKNFQQDILSSHNPPSYLIVFSYL